MQWKSLSRLSIFVSIIEMINDMRVFHELIEILYNFQWYQFLKTCRNQFQEPITSYKARDCFALHTMLSAIGWIFWQCSNRWWPLLKVALIILSKTIMSVNCFRAPKKSWNTSFLNRFDQQQIKYNDIQLSKGMSQIYTKVSSLSQATLSKFYKSPYHTHTKKPSKAS